jgi:hypothetical protein
VIDSAEERCTDTCEVCDPRNSLAKTFKVASIGTKQQSTDETLSSGRYGKYMLSKTTTINGSKERS